MNNTQGEVLLRVRNLKTYFPTQEGLVKAVDGVDLDAHRGEVLCLVGESGCGKSVTSLSIMRLVAKPGRTIDGSVVFDGINLLEMPSNELVNVRGNRISMIFQQPVSSLNPVIRVGDQIVEVLQIHQGMDKESSQKKAEELMTAVGIPDAQRRSKAYPHELSGGTAQRIMIAMALACSPELLIADEPTTALDVTIQAQILDLIRELCTKSGTAVILITHDLGVVAEMAKRVAVMYAGVIVEEAPVKTLFKNPLHPYTIGLIESVPVLGKEVEELHVISGVVPNLINLPKGCRFAPRCPVRITYNISICTEQEPELTEVQTDQKVRCWLYDDSQGHLAPLRTQVREVS
jgi:oligopeptide/dipeptide ABC transporter ATP-binding protein